MSKSVIFYRLRDLIGNFSHLLKEDLEKEDALPNFMFRNEVKNASPIEQPHREDDLFFSFGYV